VANVAKAINNTPKVSIVDSTGHDGATCEPHCVDHFAYRLPSCHAPLTSHGIGRVFYELSIIEGVLEIYPGSVVPHVNWLFDRCVVLLEEE
jgi:hypothetical protein